MEAVVDPQVENPEASNIEGMMSRKGKLNKKKRRQRVQMRTSRRNSKNNLFLENRTQSEYTNYW